jgi:hypothetical protein
MEYQKHFDKLKSFVEDLGYTVVESDCDSWDFATKIICYNRRRTPENRVIYTLHEAGHANRFEKLKKTYFDIHPGFHSHSEEKQKVSEVEHEALAWNEGVEIAKQLNIPVNLKKYAQIKTRCIQSYL